MTFARPLLYFLLIPCIATATFAADDGSKSQASAGSLQNQIADPALFGQPNESQPASSDLLFLKTWSRLNPSSPIVPPKAAILNDADCYTMRMYKVKRKERFADGESGSRGYSTCELASNYQVRSAIAHVETVEGNGSQIVAPKK